jgi:hypothetical protein
MIIILIINIPKPISGISFFVDIKFKKLKIVYMIFERDLLENMIVDKNQKIFQK